jgi:CRP-like cAMP-binding protein
MFEGLGDEDLDALARTLEERRIPAGQMIFNQGDPGDAMYLIVEGHVNIHLPGEASRRVSLKDITRGEYFGELGALAGRHPASSSISRAWRRSSVSKSARLSARMLLAPSRIRNATPSRSTSMTASIGTTASLEPPLRTR